MFNLVLLIRVCLLRGFSCLLYVWVGVCDCYSD